MVSGRLRVEKRPSLNRHDATISALAKSDKYGTNRTNKPSHHFGLQEKNTRYSFDHTPFE